VVVDVVAGGVFGRLAGEVLERLERDGLVVLVGPHGVGKSTLTAYAAWLALWRGAADAVVSAEEVKMGLASGLENLLKNTGRRFLLLYDPVLVTAYYEPRAMGEEAEKEKERVRRAVDEAPSAGGSGVKALVVLPDELYRDLPPEAKEALEKYVVKAVLNDVEFLHEVVRRYSGCGGDYSKLAEKIAQLDGGYTLAAKYAGLWLRDNRCKVESVERAVEEAKRVPKLFFAHYIWHVLLRGSGDLAVQGAVPLLLHARFGPVPIGVTYITKAVNDRGIWRFLKPEELEGASLESLREEALEHIAKWLTQQHEDLVEETLRDLAGLNGEEARKPYRETLRDLIEALDWARGEVLKEGAETFAKLGVPEGGRELVMSLLAFVGRRLAAVFKSNEVRRCWRRAALIAGHALARHLVLPRDLLPEDVAEALGDALKPCTVDAYLTIDGEIPLPSTYVAQLMPIRELNILSPFADTETIDDARKTAEGLLTRLRRSGISLHEAFYALGLAALAAECEVDEKTADLLLYAAPFAMQVATHSAAVLPILAALRPLGEKAPHRYIVALAVVSEPETPYPETVWYIYDALQQLKDRLTETGRLWPLVEAIRAYSNLLIKHSTHIEDRREEAVAYMCELYSMVRGRNTAAVPESDLSAHRLFDAVARANVLAVALESDVLAPLVRRYCGLGDLEREGEAVRSMLDKAAARPEELRKIVENDTDFAEWVTTRDFTGDVGFVIENVRAWFTAELTRYKLNHALDEKGELSEKKLEEAAKEFEKEVEMDRKPKDWENYLASRDWALRARVLAAKSWEEFLRRAKGFWELWREVDQHLEPTTTYLTTAAFILGEYLVYLAASGDREKAEELLKEWRCLLNYVPEVSVVARLMLRLFGVGGGMRLKEVVDAFEPQLSPEHLPALLMLAGCLQKDEALKECAKLPGDEGVDTSLNVRKECVDAVTAASGDQEAVERLKLEIEREVPEAHPLLEVADGKTLVEVLTPILPAAQLAFMLLAAVEGRVDAV
jgi:tetratricopeptide (TPR) repeat protein